MSVPPAQVVLLRDARVVGVVVYSDRAEVTRELRAQLQQGVQDVVLKGVSSCVDQDSIRVAGAGGATIVEVSSSVNRETPRGQEAESAISALQAKLKTVESDLADKSAAKRRLEKEVAFTQSFATAMTASTGSALPATALESFRQFLSVYSERLAAHDTASLALGAEMEALQKEKDALTAQLSAAGATANGSMTSHDVSITLEAREPESVALRVSYLVTKASWTPSYDIRVSSANTRLQLTYYGMIRQSTGEDWEDTEFALSTAQPSVGGTPPPIDTATVAFFAPPVAYSSYDGSMAKSASSGRRKEKRLRSRQSLELREYVGEPPHQDDESEEDVVGAAAAGVHEAGVSAAFVIPRHTTIVSDNKPHKVTIAVVELESHFVYYAVPSKVPNAYLKACTTNSSPYALLPGKVDVFFDNSFISHSAMKFVCPAEQFDSFLGVDPSVKVEYRPVTKFKESVGVFGRSCVETFKYETVVKNTKSVPVQIQVTDQVPRSSDERIKVKLVTPEIGEGSEGVKLTDKNNVEWTLTIREGAEHRIPFEYRVEYPNAKQISVRG